MKRYLQKIAKVRAQKVHFMYCGFGPCRRFPSHGRISTISRFCFCKWRLTPYGWRRERRQQRHSHFANAMKIYPLMNAIDDDCPHEIVIYIICDLHCLLVCMYAFMLTKFSGTIWSSLVMHWYCSTYYLSIM